MPLPRLLSNTDCKHALNKIPQGVALITVGKSLRGDDGLAAALSRCLPEHLSQKVCRFNLGSYSSFLEDCLRCHKAAIIIDATSNGTTPGTVSILDISHVLDQANKSNLRTCHGFSLDTEVQRAKKRKRREGLPARVIFFGVEIDDNNWNEALSTSLESKLPKLVSRLTFLITKVVETLMA